MSSRSVTSLAVLILLLKIAANAQPVPTSLTMPLNSTATQTQFLFTFSFPPSPRAVFFNSKDEPTRVVGTDLFRYFVYISDFSGASGIAEAMANTGFPFSVANYPNLTVRGGYFDPSGDGVRDFDAIDHYFGIDYDAALDYYQTWSWGQTSVLSPRVTAATCGNLVNDNNWVVVGYDYTSGGNPSHYCSYMYDIGLGFNPIPRGTMPLGLAIYDLALYDEDQPHGLIAVATQDIGVEPPVPPLISGYVITEALYWVSDMTAANPVWNRFVISTDEIRNLQISLSGSMLRAVGLNSSTDRFVTFRARFEDYSLVDWQEIPTATNLPDGSIPYDIQILDLIADQATILTATSSGLFKSTDDGVHWQAENPQLGIRTPSFRHIALAQDHHFVSVAGWQASYIGEANNDWDFSWREIHYEPTLYQHWCRAWSCVGTIATEDMINVALIDHSTDEFFPDEQPVVVQVQPNFGASQSQKTVYLGSQDEGTRPFLLGTSVPAVVFNREGPEGPVVLEAEPPDYLTWTANPLYDEPTDPPASVYDVVSSRYGNYIAFDQTQSGSPLNRLWRDLGEGWERADASGILPEMFFGHLAASDDALFYLWPGGGQHLYISTDQGTNFTEMLHDIGFDVVSSMSVGERAEMPLYIGDHLNNTGRIICRYRHPLDENWYAAPISYGTVLDVVADPCVPWLLWARVNEPGNNRETIRMYYYFPTEPPNVSLGDAKWWVPDGSHAGEYSVRDIRVSALDEHRRIMDVTLQTPNSNDADVDHTVVKRWDFNVPGTLPPYLPSTTAGTWLLAGDVVIPAEHTVTIEPGTVLLCAPMAKLIVEGSLIVNGNVEKEVVFKRVAQDQSDAWEGLYVEGDCELNYCTIEGASIGIESHKAVSLEMDHCTVRDCGVGFYAYQPAGSAEPQISYCTFMGNDHEGISLLETAGAAITNCEITGNGDTGILLVDSYAKLVENRVRENGYPESYYGLECFGSSPVLYCNEFENNMKGEVALFNQSYPVLWNNNGAGGGNNTFLNDSKTLVTMYDSYPLLMKGENNFYLGTQGYFLADMSAKPTAQDISGNYWNPSLSLSLLYPPDPDVWKWWSTNPTSSSCGSGILDFEGGPEELFEQGFYAEMNDNPEQAEASYTSLLTTYPDSTLALAAAARLFELSRQADSSHANLQDYLFTLAETHAEDTVLAKSLRAVATRLWVQEHIYGNPLDYYTGIMNDPPTEVDSVFAALDHTGTTLVQQYEEGGGGGLDCAGPTVSVSSLRTLRSEVGTALPEAPLNEHEGYSLPPSDYVLEQNYPNPFNAMTTIRYYLPEETRVQVALYNLMGQKVADLVDDVQPTGYHTVNWNAVALASGVYVYQLKAGKFSDAKKMVLIR